MTRRFVSATLLALLVTPGADCADPERPNWSLELGNDPEPDAPEADAPVDAEEPDTDEPEDDPVLDTESDAESGVVDATGDAADADSEPEPPQPWRSVLYPEDWTPAFTDDQGRFLHDFSYAGYHNGEDVVASGAPELLIDVVEGHGADPTGTTDATAAFQSALDAAGEAGGAVVFVPEGLYRLDGVLTVGSSRVVLRGEGPALSRLYFTRHEGLSFASHITFRGALSSDLEVALVTDAPARDLDVEVADAGDLAVGDEVALGWVITADFIEAHAMTGTWQAFNDTWQPFFWREVVAIDRASSPNRVTLDVPSRYPALVRDAASLRRQRGTLRECGVEALGLANAVGWDEAWAQDQVHVLELDGVADCWVTDVASFVSPAAPTSGGGLNTHLQSGGLLLRRAKRVTVAETVLERAEHRGSGGNGYLFEVRQSSEVLFRDCLGRDGRHNFIQNWGFGATGIVWLRVRSDGGRAYPSQNFPIASIGLSEMHHSLATANLIDSSRFDDGWGMVNRQGESTGAGHTGTQNVVWNVLGRGDVRSSQFGWGYIIGADPRLDIRRTTEGGSGAGTAPEDWLEGDGEAATLVPQSLYEDQLAKRLGR